MDLPVRPLLLGMGWCVGWWLCCRVRGVPDTVGSPSPPPALSVVIPARDEERALPTLLVGLAEQTTPAAEIIVVDDHSADRTARAAKAGGARVLSSAPLPDGWTGKPWALRQGVEAATSDVVVLFDADVEPAPELLERLGAYFGSHGGLVSVQPYHHVRHWWERASAFFNLVAVMGVGFASPRVPPRVRAAFGPCVACRREDYLRHADHPQVRRAVLEDVALARRFADAGEPVACFGGRRLVTFRMYDHPVRLVEGWAKNIAAGCGSISAARLVLVVAWMTACLAGGWGVIAGSWLAIGLYAAFALQLTVMLRQVGSFGPLTAALYPVLGAVFVAIFVWSLVLTARGEVRWKDRVIRLRGS